MRCCSRGAVPTNRYPVQMTSWLVHRRLAQGSDRLRRLRDELAMVEEQLAVVVEDAEDHELRALVSETPAAAFEANDARKHADAMRRHRDHVAERIAELERRQDQLLDSLAAGGSAERGGR